MNEIELTKKLVEINSFSGDERIIGDYVAQLLEKEFVVTKQAVENRWNILAARGDPLFLCTSHLDTVPGIVAVNETETTLFGRGSCDAKASVAAMIIASLDCAKEGYTNFGLLFDVSEETDFSGITEAVKIIKPNIVVIGEPTSNEFVVGQKGLLEIKVSCQGVACHAATPEKGESAIEQLIACLAVIKTIDIPEENTLGKTTCNIGVIKGGTAVNVVPEYAEALLSFRTTCANDHLLKQIQSLDLPCTVNVIVSFDPALCNTAAFASFAMLRKSVPYFTELWFWKNAQAIVCGPGNADFAHTTNEQIEKKEITKAKEIYTQMIHTFAQKTL